MAFAMIYYPDLETVFMREDATPNALRWTSNAHEARRFPFDYMAGDFLKTIKGEHGLTFGLFTWIANEEPGPLRWVRGRKEIDDLPCKVCGEPIRLTFMEDTLQRMCERRMCLSCDFWECIASKENGTVIKGHVYTPGNGYGSRDCGMSGRRFDIEYFDGRRITTYDLWSQGTVPEAFRDRIPDTARFLDGARRAQVGETTCWNPSSHQIAPYPLPNGKPAPWPYGQQVAEAIGQVAKRMIQAPTALPK